MSTTMNCVQDLCNPAHASLSVHGAPVQAGTPWPSSTAQGFVVLDKAGEFIAWAACPVVAKKRLDGDPLAQTVERCSDGELMAWKYGKRKARL